MTHVYTAVGNYAISATATVSDGQGGTYTAVTGGTAGALGSGFGTGVTQLDTDGSHPAASVAIDPNGDLAVATGDELTLYTANGVPDPGFPTVNTGFGHFGDVSRWRFNRTARSS